MHDLYSGGKGLGKGGAKRHRKVLRDNIQGKCEVQLEWLPSVMSFSQPSDEKKQRNMRLNLRRYY